MKKKSETEKAVRAALKNPLVKVGMAFGALVALDVLEKIEKDNKKRKVMGMGGKTTRVHCNCGRKFSSWKAFERHALDCKAGLKG